MRTMPVLAVSGLRKRTGHNYITEGVFKPRVLVDSNLPISAQFNAAVYHEIGHVVERHALKGILLLLLLPALGVALYPFFRRYAEGRADKYAVREAGQDAFRAFVYLTNEPHSWWTRWIYTPSRASRLRRAGVAV